MLCPACRKEMSARSFGPVTVDVCERGCGGLWFDWAELGKVDEPHEGLGEALETALGISPGERRSQPLRCTRCDMLLREHRYQNLPGVLIDECYGCRGYFLDPGELAAIRQELGTRKGEFPSVEALLANDPYYKIHRQQMDEEKERAEALKAMSKLLTRVHWKAALARLGRP